MKRRKTYNPYTGRSDFLSFASCYTGTVAPSDPEQGDMFLNTDTCELQVYFYGSWQTIKILQGLLSFILLESGDILLFENLDRSLLEFSVSGESGSMLLEDSDLLLLELTDGSMLISEGA